MEIEILPWSLRFGLKDCDNSEVERVRMFLRLSREATVALPFFRGLHYRSLCRIILNENEADFPYSDKKIWRLQLHVLLHFLVFSFTTLTSSTWVESSHNRLNI